jgi:hypothetical protein
VIGTNRAPFGTGEFACGYSDLGRGPGADGERSDPELRLTITPPGIRIGSTATTFFPCERAWPHSVEARSSYVPNGEQDFAATNPTYRVADLSNPILKPWAVEQMARDNDAVSLAKVPSSREKMLPGGVPSSTFSAAWGADALFPADGERSPDDLARRSAGAACLHERGALGQSKPSCTENRSATTKAIHWWSIRSD